MKAKKENYVPICDYVCETADRVNNNDKASPELRAAVNEFRDKSMELRQNFDDDDIKHSITEVEQAADSALQVAQSSNSPEDITTQIKDAHDRIRDFKETFMS